MMEILKFKLNILRNHLAFLKAQNEITSQLLNIIKEATILNNKPSFFNTITKYFKELLLCKK